MNLRTLIHSALAVGLIMAFFTLFRGITNLANAFFVPATLSITGMTMKGRERGLLYIASLVFCSLFFQVQFFFLALYCLVAEVLHHLNRKSVSRGMAVAVLSLASGLGFFAAIRLTDGAFHTRMHFIFMSLFDGNLLAYGAMLAAEGLLAGILLVTGVRSVAARLHRYVSISPVSDMYTRKNEHKHTQGR